jgi:sterol desaturase/sphingolipid hydroxylase (fatty acid hydroxylase superfamily)
MSEIAGARDARGEWKPAEQEAAAPIWAWPPRPLKALRWIVSYPGYLLPWNPIYFAIALCTWVYLTPEMARMAEFRVSWMAEIYVRNLVLYVLWAGALHVRLYRFRSQGAEYKFSPKWIQGDNPAFLWGSQLRDNVFWSMASGCAVWTAYEVVLMWGYANGFITTVDWGAEPVYFALMLFAVPVWRGIHFYWSHRLTHWKPLYRTVHYLHHKNVNIGPWSGMAMHPAEHVIYLSLGLLYWIVPSHPLMMIFALQHAAFGAATGHIGFQNLVVKGNAKLPANGYYHYLHHRYFECNYGNALVPFDKWFGTFHDGSPESHARMTEKWAKNRA